MSGFASIQGGQGQYGSQAILDDRQYSREGKMAIDGSSSISSYQSPGYPSPAELAAAMQVLAQAQSQGVSLQVQPARIRLADGSTYVGDLVDGKPHGPGILHYPPGNDRSRYEGTFQNGLRHGQGRTFLTNGAVYIGGYANNEASGQGKYTYAPSADITDVASDEGEFANDQIIHGTRIWNNRRKYVGAFANNNANGEGVLTYPVSYGGGYEYTFRDEGVFKDGRLWKGRHTGSGPGDSYTRENGEKVCCSCVIL